MPKPLGIDVGDIRYNLTVFPPTGKKVHLSNATPQFVYEEVRGEYSMRLKASVANLETGEGLMQDLLAPNTQVMVSANWGSGMTEIQRFTVRVWEPVPAEGLVNIEAYDDMFPLLKSKVDFYYPAGTSGKIIIEELASQWNIPIGTIDGPNVALAKQKGTDTIAAIFAKVCEESADKDDGIWIIRFEEGELRVTRPGWNSPIYVLEEGVNIEAIGERQDITELITRVLIVGASDENTKAPIIETKDQNTEFGVFQEIVPKEEANAPESAQTTAARILRNKSSQKKVRPVENAPDAPPLRRGHYIKIRSGTLNGMYRVAGVTHTASTRTMNLEVETLESDMQ